MGTPQSWAGCQTRRQGGRLREAGSGCRLPGLGVGHTISAPSLEPGGRLRVLDLWVFN